MVSENYVRKRWTRHEWRAAQARAFEEFERAYILPVRLDESELPGLLRTVGDLSLPRLGIEKVNQLIYEKVADTSQLNQAVRLAEVKHEEGQHHEALRLLEDRRFDGFVPALRVRAGAYRALRRYAEAIQSLEGIAATRPDDFEALFLLGICHFRAGNFEEAITWYERAKRLTPSHITVITDLAAARRWAKLAGLPIVGNWLRSRIAASVRAAA